MEVKQDRRRLPRRALQRDAAHRQGGGRRGRQRQPARDGRQHSTLSAGSAAGKPRASGTISGEIKFAGKGTSPRGVLSVLQGGGTLELGDAKLGTLWPGAIGTAVEAALKADPDSLAAILKRDARRRPCRRRAAAAGPVGVEIADGRLAAKPFAIDTAEGRAQGAASLDLKTLAFESDWRLEPEAAGVPPTSRPCRASR